MPMTLIIRSCISLVLCFVTSVAFAATYHVASVTCSNHGNVQGGRCSNATSCGSAATPCCTLQSAMKISALTSGDVIQAHNETKVYASADDSGCAVYIDVKGITIEEAPGDSYVIDMANNASVPRGVRVAASNVTVKGIKVIGKVDSCVDTSRTGVFEIGSSGVSVSNVTLDGIEADNEEYCRSPETPVTSSYVGVLIRYGAHGVTVKNVTNFRGGYNSMVFVWNCGVDPAGGYLFRDNVWTNTRNEEADSTATGLKIENCGSDTTSAMFVSFNEFYKHTGTQTHRFLYFRESGIAIRIINGRFIATSALSNAADILLQEDLEAPGGWTEEDVLIANNYFKSGGGTAVRWPGCFDAEIRNNIFDGYSTGANESSSCYSGNTSSVRSGSFTNNALSGPTLVTCSDNCVSTAGSVAKATINATSDGRLQATSTSCIDGGTPNPMGLGVNACSLSIRGESIDCTASITGVRRGAIWDIGADEYAGVTTCGNGVLDSGEACDGAILNGATCSSLGFGTGVVSCVACRYDTTRCIPPTPANFRRADSHGGS